MRVLHAITATDDGGAEHALRRLLPALAARGVSSAVLSLKPPGAVAERIAAQGVPVASLGLRDAASDLGRGEPESDAPGRDAPGRPAPGRPAPGRAAVRRLAALPRLLRAADADVVHTWLFHADLAVGVPARAQGRPLVWSLRRTAVTPADGLATWALARSAARLSWRLPDAVVACSSAAGASHVAEGYDPRRITVIENGFDAADVPAEPTGRLRALLGVPPGRRLVGRVARDHPMKDHETLFAALGPVLRARDDVDLVLWGGGCDPQASHLRALVAREGLDADPRRRRVHLLGLREDTAALYGDLDVLVSSSAWGEGFPNVLAEALLAGVPVAATDVGASARIVGDDGRIVPPRDPARLGAAVAALLDDPAWRAPAQRARARARVLDRFGLATMADRYAALYAQVHARHEAPARPGDARR